MKKAQDVFKDFGVSAAVKICSAHRSPNFLHKLTQDYKDAKVFIAGAF
jgi:phosphoribosylcarboxyaminoimidazole (NCAIR) mutase